MLTVTATLIIAAWWIRSLHHFDQYSIGTSTRVFTMASYNGRCHAWMTRDCWAVGRGWRTQSDDGEYGTWECETQWPVYAEDAGRTWFIGHCHSEGEMGVVQFYVVAAPICSIWLATFLPFAAMLAMRSYRRRNNTRRGFAVLIK